MSDSKDLEKQLLDEVKLITELSSSLDHSCCYDNRERKIVDQLIENAVMRYGLFKAEGKVQQEYVKKSEFDKHLLDAKDLAIIMSAKFKTLEHITETDLKAFLDNWKENFRIIHSAVKFLLGEVNGLRLYNKYKNSDFEEPSEEMDLMYEDCKKKLWDINNGN